MRVLTRLGFQAYRHVTRPQHLPRHVYGRSIATHPYNHHATALSVLPTNVDASSADFKENTRQFKDVTARLQEIHNGIEQGGPQKAREKHVARGKMLPREYVTVC